MTSRAAQGTLDVGGRPSRWVRRGAVDGTVVLFAHGAGAPLTSDWMEGVSAALVDRGLCVARFHFPYMHRVVTEGKRRPPDRSPICVDAWGAMIRKARGWKGVERLVLMGKSMGGRMASMWLAEQGDVGPVACAIYLGYPLHPPGKPEKLRSEHLGRVGVPQLFVSGTKDPLCTLSLLKREVRSVKRAQISVVEGGDHSLVRTRREAIDGSQAWLDEVARAAQK